MTPELETQIISKYPNIFKNCSKSPQESCMSFGLEVGDGWFNIINTLCESLTYMFTSSVEVDRHDAERLNIAPITWKGTTNYYFHIKPPQVIADQVKEKFGTLRFYYHLEFDPVNLDLVNTGKYPSLVAANERYENFICGIIHFAETASGRTCEVTGSAGELHSRGGWVKVLNTHTAKALDYEPTDYKPKTMSSPIVAS